jgi:hypothetical protein
VLRFGRNVAFLTAHKRYKIVGLLAAVSPVSDLKSLTASLFTICRATKLLTIYIPKCNGQGNRLYIREGICYGVLCVAKDETSVDIMCRRFCCNFLWKSRLWQIWLARRLTPDVSAVYVYIHIYVWSIVGLRGVRLDPDETPNDRKLTGFGWFWSEWSSILFDGCSAARTNVVLRIVMSTITVVWLVSSLPLYFYTMTSHRDIYIYNC